MATGGHDLRVLDDRELTASSAWPLNVRNVVIF